MLKRNNGGRLFVIKLCRSLMVYGVTNVMSKENIIKCNSNDNRLQLVSSNKNNKKPMERIPGQGGTISMNFKGIVSSTLGYGREDFMSLREEPHVSPEAGIVQPPFKPTPDRPGRWTNQLDYLWKVVESIYAHKVARPFQHPVDTIYLNLPDYHQIIERPMDLSTIKKRLKNNYYWTALECLRDFQRIFYNCKKYNQPTDGIIQLGLAVEELFRKKISDMPKSEIQIETRSFRKQLSKKKKARHPVDAKSPKMFKKVAQTRVVPPRTRIISESRRNWSSSSSSCSSQSSVATQLVIRKKARIDVPGVSSSSSGSSQNIIKDGPNPLSSSSCSSQSSVPTQPSVRKKARIDDLGVSNSSTKIIKNDPNLSSPSSCCSQLSVATQPYVRKIPGVSSSGSSSIKNIIKNGSNPSSSSSCLTHSSVTTQPVIQRKANIDDLIRVSNSSDTNIKQNGPNSISSTSPPVSSVSNRKFGKSSNPFKDFKENETCQNQNEVVMSMEKRQELLSDVGRLNIKQYYRLFHIILQMEPPLSVNVESDEIEFDLEKLTQATLWKADDYIAGCLKKKPVFVKAEPVKSKADQILPKQQQEKPVQNALIDSGSSYIQSAKSDATTPVSLIPAKTPEKKASLHQHRQGDRPMSSRETIQLLSSLESLPSDKVGGVLGILVGQLYDTGALTPSTLGKLKLYIDSKSSIPKK